MIQRSSSMLYRLLLVRPGTLDAAVNMATLPEEAERFDLGQYGAQAVTKDGKHFYIRPVMSTDSDLLMALFNSLSPRSIFFRFLRNWKTVPPEMVTLFTQIDCRQNVAMVALEAAVSKPRMLGLCGILRHPGSTRGELGVVVCDQWQGKGVGAKLVEISVQVARDLGMTDLWGIISPENTTMLAVAEKLGFSKRKDPHADLYEIEMKL
jgi:acetyltransferase